MILNQEEIQKIAHLARLYLSEKEVEKYTKELDEILGFFEKLKEVDTNNIKPLSQITGLSNATRKDQVLSSDLAEKLVKCSPSEIYSGHLKVKNVF